MNTPFFSIVIPVYNGLSHNFSKCLDSIWNQPLAKELYEVICVDDCSTDSTRAWLKEQQKVHSNLHIIENEINIRQDKGRNKGVKAAKGKYIVFIDSDDYFHHDGLATVYKFIKEKDLDILVSDSAYQFKGYEHNNLQLNLKYREETNSENFIKNNGFAIAPWRLCLNRDFYNNSGVSFVENTRVEDVDWGVHIYYYAKKIQYQPILLVHYIKAENGTSDTMYKQKQTLIDNIVAANRTLKLAHTLYKDSINKNTIETLADSYYKRTCTYLLGLFSSIETKKEIISHIGIKKSRHLLVNLAINNPTIFAILSNCAVLPYRFIRKIHRRRTAKKLQKQK